MEQKKKMPLEGIRVVELATVVAAPTASRVLPVCRCLHAGLRGSGREHEHRV